MVEIEEEKEAAKEEKEGLGDRGGNEKGKGGRRSVRWRRSRRREGGMEKERRKREVRRRGRRH